MKVDILPYESWELLNTSVKELLNIDAEYSIKSYLGASRAVFEVVLATAQFYSHKRSIAVLPGRTPHFLSVLPYFYKEGYEVQTAPKDFNAKEWVDSLKKDTCLVMIAEDHAITAETSETNEIEEIERLLNEKKIFCVILSHHKHLYHSQMPQGYSVRIHSYAAQTAVAICGSKFKAPNLISQHTYWDEPLFMKELVNVRKCAGENKSLIQDFESKLPAGYKALFSGNFASRVFDRALIYSEEVGGESLQQFIATKLSTPVLAPGFELGIETTHLCRWGGTIASFDWWQDRPHEDILRGLLLLSTELIKRPNIQEVLSAAMQECHISEFN